MLQRSQLPVLLEILDQGSEQLQGKLPAQVAQREDSSQGPRVKRSTLAVTQSCQFDVSSMLQMHLFDCAKLNQLHT